jgi:hypothetical protein
MQSVEIQQVLSAACLTSGSCLVYSSILKMGRNVPLNCRFTCNELHGVVSEDRTLQEYCYESKEMIQDGKKP